MNDMVKRCIDACSDCAVASAQCAIACIEELDNSTLTRCIKLNLDCKSVCYYAIDAMASNSEFMGRICEICAEICDTCAQECDRHAHLDHCRMCAEACQLCAEECRSMVGVAA